MTTVVFPSRLLCDISFYRKHIRPNRSLLLKLMRINVNSKNHKKDHVLISKNNFNEILKEEATAAKYPDLIMAGLKRIEEPELIENEPNEIARNIEYGIYLSSQPPHFTSTIILTTNEKIYAYYKSHRLKEMKTVAAKADEDALAIIEDFYDYCMARN